MIVNVQGCPNGCQGGGSQAEDDGDGQGVENHFEFLFKLNKSTPEIWNLVN